MKKVRELESTVALIRRLLTSEGFGLVHGDQLRKAFRKLEEAEKGGNARQLVRATAEISQRLCEELLKK